MQILVCSFAEPRKCGGKMSIVILYYWKKKSFFWNDYMLQSHSVLATEIPKLILGLFPPFWNFYPIYQDWATNQQIELLLELNDFIYDLSNTSERISLPCLTCAYCLYSIPYQITSHNKFIIDGAQASENSKLTLLERIFSPKILRRKISKG